MLRNLDPKKVLLSIWWDWKDIVYYELFSQDEIINSAKYCNQFDKLKDAIIEKRPKLTNRWVHYNAKPHTALIVRENQFDWNILSHLLYSPFVLLAISYYFFLLLKNFLHDKRFQSISEIKTHFEDYFANKSQQFWNNEASWEIEESDRAERFIYK